MQHSRQCLAFIENKIFSLTTILVDKSVASSFEFGLAFSLFLSLTLSFQLLLLDLGAFVHELNLLILVVLVVLYVAIGSSTTHMARVVLRCMLRLIVDRHSTHGHNSDVLCNIFLTYEVTHVVFVTNRVFFIRLLLLLDL